MEGSAARAPLLVSLLAASMAASCGGSASTADPHRPTPQPESRRANAEAGENRFEGTAGIVERGPAGSGELATAAAVRAARHEGFDRVTFEFSGPALPGFHLEYIDRPVRQCGSGHPTEIAGDGWLEVRFEPARGHDEAGSPTVAGELLPDLPVLLEIERTCDFEGVLTFVLGVRSPNRYRVLDLTDPVRLAVDIEH